MNKLFASIAGLAIIFSAATVSFADEGKGRSGDNKPVPAEDKAKGKSAESKGAEKKADAAPSQGGDTSGGSKAGDDLSDKSSGPAGKSPSGNNGTIKFHETTTGDRNETNSDAELRRNQPHLSCSFYLYGFHFDGKNANNAAVSDDVDWEIVYKSPTTGGKHGSTGAQSSGATAQGAGTDSGADGDTVVFRGREKVSAEGDWRSRDLSIYGSSTHKQGIHVKISWQQVGSKHAKHKVVWVQPCEQPEQPEQPPVVGGQQYDCIAGNGIPNQQSGRDDAAGCESTGGQQYDCIAGNGIPNQTSGRDDAAGCEVVGGVENTPVFTEVIVETGGAVIDAGVVLGVQNADAALALAALTNLPSTSTDAGSARGLFALAGLIFTLGGAQLLRRTAKTI